jgi:hypothetical protein
MNNDIALQYATIASVASVGITSINGLVYWIILEVKYNDKINILSQFLGLISACICQVGLLLTNLGYFNDTPMIGVVLNNTSWQVFFTCYFIIFIRQCNTLIPKNMVYGSWVYLVFLNVIAVLDTYAYYLEYCVSDKWTWLGILIDVTSSVFIVILECIINIWIIVKIAKKVRNRANSGYKILVLKLSIALILFLVLDIVIISCDLSNNQSYGCILWGVNYALKIQVETLCLGKIRECIIILENYENA